MKKLNVAASSLLILLGMANLGSAETIGSHAFTWWDAPGLGVVVTPLGAAAPAPGSTRLLDLEEWHLDQAQTKDWYDGKVVTGLPSNPFDPLNRTGIIGAITPVSNSEAFIYRITNFGYDDGNGFTFSPPSPPGLESTTYRESTSSTTAGC